MPTRSRCPFCLPCVFQINDLIVSSVHQSGAKPPTRPYAVKREALAARKCFFCPHSLDDCCANVDQCQASQLRYIEARPRRLHRWQQRLSRACGRLVWGGGGAGGRLAPGRISGRRAVRLAAARPPGSLRCGAGSDIFGWTEHRT
eukprot:351557-Chlamydomonas_euryale.AAC.3